jgi:hypothetical protein
MEIEAGSEAQKARMRVIHLQTLRAEREVAERAAIVVEAKRWKREDITTTNPERPALLQGPERSASLQNH